MTMEGSPPYNQVTRTTDSVLSLPAWVALFAKWPKKPASLTNFTQHGDSAEFVRQLRPAWWHSSVLMQMRLHRELVMGVNEHWAQ